jgi:bacterioferritin-associated ferredoxin
VNSKSPETLWANATYPAIYFMTETSNKPSLELICKCSGTTKQQVKALVDKCIDNPERISGITGACSGCGACDTSILEFLAEFTTKTDT